MDDDRGYGWCIPACILKWQVRKLRRLVRPEAGDESAIIGIKQFDQDVVLTGQVARDQVCLNEVLVIAGL